VHNVLKSYDTLGGPATNGSMIMSKKFYDANPKISAAVYAAVTEANDFINKKPNEAAEIYIKATNEKRSTQSEMAKFISDPDNIWTTTPQQNMNFASFMNKVGTMKRLPNSWKDLYMPVCHELPGA
jgi:NitT/TauT family transport system substrate-binding protein